MHAGLSAQTARRRLADPAARERVLAARPPCGVCRGRGWCKCVHCEARWAESALSGHQADRSFVDGRTCHLCLGSGKSPIRTAWDRSRTRPRAWVRLRAIVLAHWVAANGPVCPGFMRSAHAVPTADLTVDHRAPTSRGGSLLDRANLAVLCRSCNSRKNDAPDPASDGPAERYRGQKAASAAVGAALQAARSRSGQDLGALAVRLEVTVTFLAGIEAGEVLLDARNFNATWMGRWYTAGVDADAILRVHGAAFGLDYIARRKQGLRSRIDFVTSARRPFPKRKRWVRERFNLIKTTATHLEGRLDRARDHASIDSIRDAVVRDVEEAFDDLVFVANTGHTRPEWAEILLRHGPSDPGVWNEFLELECGLGGLDAINVAALARSRLRVLHSVGGVPFLSTDGLGTPPGSQPAPEGLS